MSDQFDAVRGILNSVALGAVFWLACLGVFLLITKHC